MKTWHYLLIGGIVAALVTVFILYSALSVPSNIGSRTVAPGGECTSDAECGEGFSCWSQPPRGPAAGVRGTPDSPGACWDNSLISQTV